jgi:ubiquinone/menaquinone biosynthesis C-methylase UbiE
MSFHNNKYAEIYDLLYSDIKQDIPFYLEYAKLKGSPILEIACGTGRVLIPLAKEGYEVWGIDLSHAMLAKSKEKISELPKEVKNRIHLKQADMRVLQLNKQFNLVLVPFRSFLLLKTVKDQIQTLKNLRKNLKEEGLLIIDIFAPKYDFLTQSKRKATKKVMNPQNNHVLYRKAEIIYDHANQSMKANYTFEEQDEKERTILSFQKTLELRYIFRYEMEHLLSLSGFKLKVVYGTFDKKLYDYKSGEMIFIAKKI